MSLRSSAGGIFLTAHNALHPKRLANFLIALHGGSLVKGSVTAALELTEKTAMVLRGYKAGKVGEGSYMETPRTAKGNIVGAGRVSPSQFEYGLGYGATEYTKPSPKGGMGERTDSFFQ